MSSAAPGARTGLAQTPSVADVGLTERPGWRAFPSLPVALSLALLAFVVFPPVRDNPRLVWTFAGVSSATLAWGLLLWARARRTGRHFGIEYAPYKSHYVQACVQLGILAFWGWHAPAVPAAAPLILAQVLFLYILEGLITWSRGRTWRLGYGPLPIIFSTNLLLWFKDDWFFLQFLMIAVGVVGKQFITWQRDGRRTHIFNPSAFGQAALAAGLIATGTTNDLTWGREIASTFEVPHMLIVIFLGGLIVQSLFHVTLMTVAAAAALCAINLVYTQATGVYYFVNVSIAAPIFLGIHLLITDPATSPRTNLGRAVFGVLYALGYAALFRLLDLANVPTFWDKLLPVPILNLCVPLIDRAARSGVGGALNRAWEAALKPPALNLVHMGCWGALFLTLVGTGFVEGPHPGNSIPFWKQAHADAKPFAGNSLVMAAGALAEGSRVAGAFNELGLICAEGRIVPQNRAAAARYFERACELGSLEGCANVAIQYLFLFERRSDDTVSRALERLEQECERAPDWGACYLVGAAYETGRGRPKDPGRAIALYERCGPQNLYAVKGLARIALSGGGGEFNPAAIAPVLLRAARVGDAESCWYLAHMHRAGLGVQPDERRARALLNRACALGLDEACGLAERNDLPPFSRPRMLVPGWSTAYPPPAE